MEKEVTSAMQNKFENNFKLNLKDLTLETRVRKFIHKPSFFKKPKLLYKNLKKNFFDLEPGEFYIEKAVGHAKRKAAKLNKKCMIIAAYDANYESDSSSESDLEALYDKMICLYVRYEKDKLETVKDLIKLIEDSFFIDQREYCGMNPIVDNKMHTQDIDEFNKMFQKIVIVPAFNTHYLKKNIKNMKDCRTVAVILGQAQRDPNSNFNSTKSGFPTEIYKKIFDFWSNNKTLNNKALTQKQKDHIFNSGLNFK